MPDRNPPRFESYRPGQESAAPGRRPRPATPAHPQFRSPPKPASRFGAGLLYAGLALVALAGGAAAFLFMALPGDLIQSRIAAEVKERTGRDLVVAGPASLTFFPSLGVTLADVSLSAPPGMDSKPLVTMAGLDVSVGLLPLLRHEVEVKRLVLKKPRFNLEIDAKGQRSWDFASATGTPAPARVRFAQAPAETATDAAPAPAEPERTRIGNLELADVRIEAGALRYADARSGAEETFEQVYATLALASIAAPLEARGRLVWKARTVDFNGTLTSLDALLEDRPARLALALASDAMNVAFDGTASFAEAFAAEGTLRGGSPSARSLASWLGTELAPSNGFGPLTIAALMRTDGTALAFSDAEIALDGATAKGQLTIVTGGERPRLKAELAISELDLNKYMTSGEASPAVETAPAAAETPAQSINDLLERETPGSKVKGFTARAGWSRDPIDLGGLGALDADAKLAVARLLWRDIKSGPAELSVTLANSAMKATFDDIALYDGRGTGIVTVDATAPAAPTVGANMTLDGVSARPFLKDATGIDWLEGNGRLAFALAGKGRNQHEIVETLNGTIAGTFTNGAIVGINIPGMARALGEGRIADLSSAPADKTDFSEFQSTWTVSAGVATNQDLKLVSPLLRVAGEGRVMLPAREIDYLLKPRLVADLAGQGGDQNAKGIEVPVRVSGPWEKPKFKADLAEVVKDPNKAVETIKEIGKQFKGKKAGEILKGLFGDGNGAETAPSTPSGN